MAGARALTYFPARFAFAGPEAQFAINAADWIEKVLRQPFLAIASASLLEIWLHILWRKSL
jgi:hypothetical protein